MWLFIFCITQYDVTGAGKVALDALHLLWRLQDLADSDSEDKKLALQRGDWDIEGHVEMGDLTSPTLSVESDIGDLTIKSKISDNSNAASTSKMENLEAKMDISDAILNLEKKQDNGAVNAMTNIAVPDMTFCTRTLSALSIEGLTTECLTLLNEMRYVL